MEQNQTKLLISTLRPFYEWAEPFSWLLVRGYEYPLMWGLIMLAIALRGGGPYSIDRRLGREL
jgi:putative oxidoreductase